jgi:hypothetical protein
MGKSLETIIDFVRSHEPLPADVNRALKVIEQRADRLRARRERLRQLRHARRVRAIHKANEGDAKLTFIHLDVVGSDNACKAGIETLQEAMHAH